MPTLAVHQIGADTLLQVHPQGIWHVIYDRCINRWPWKSDQSQEQFKLTSSFTASASSWWIATLSFIWTTTCQSWCYCANLGWNGPTRPASTQGSFELQIATTFLCQSGFPHVRQGVMRVISITQCHYRFLFVEVLNQLSNNYSTNSTTTSPSHMAAIPCTTHHFAHTIIVFHQTLYIYHNTIFNISLWSSECICPSRNAETFRQLTAGRREGGELSG